MEFPVEGNYTPNFTESECSIRIPGIAWNGESPRSLGETPRITSPNKDSRDGRVQAFSAQRTSNTSRPTEELPSVESIMKRVCSQMCNDLRRSGVLKDEVVDTVAARVYSELSSRCIRRSTDPDESVPASLASGRSSVNNESRTGQNKRCKSSNDDRYSVVSRAAQGRTVVKSANSLKTKDEESRNSSKSSRVRSSRADSAQAEIATTSRSLVSRNLTRSRTPAHGQHGTPANTTSSRGSVLELSVDQNSYTPLPFIRRTLSSGKQSIQSTPRSTEGRSSGNVQERSKSSQSGSKQDNKTALLGPSKIPRRIESSTFIGRESESSRSSASRIPVRTRTPSAKDVAQVTSKEDKLRQASAPTVYSTTNSPNSFKSAHFGDQVNRCKSVDSKINQDEWEMCYSPQVSSTMSGVGLSAPFSNEDANMEKRIFDAKGKAPKLASETSGTSQTSMRNSSGRSSKIPMRSVMPEVTEPANAKAKDNAKKMSKEKYEDPNTRVNECAKNVSCKENKTPSGIFNKAKKKASVPKTEHKTEENTHQNALERRKAYEAKRKLQRKGDLAAKTAKKTETASKKQTNHTGDKDEPKTKAGQGPTVSTEVPIIEEKPCHNEDNFTYEDDFEPVEEEERNVHHESAVDTDTGIVDRALAKSPESRIEMEPVNHDIKQESPIRYGHTEGDPDNTLRLNFMTDKEIHAWQVDTVIGRVAVDCGRVNPSSTRPDVDFGYLGHPISNDLAQSQSGYHPEYCLTHMHPSIAHVYDNLDQIPEYKRMKEKTKRKAGKRTYADENEHVRRKPSNAKKKTTVGYVPGYGAVRVMKEDVGQACPGGRKRTSSNTSFPVIENQPKPGRTQRPVVGYVPGYGPVRGPSVQVFPEVPSERVVLPPLDFGQAYICNGDVKRSKKGRDKKRSEDLLENRARAKPFNTYVDEEASRRFERQYARHR